MENVLVVLRKQGDKLSTVEDYSKVCFPLGVYTFSDKYITREICIGFSKERRV